MIKIISQDEKEVFDLERNNVFVCGNKILLSDKVNVYEGKAALLGIYNDEEEAFKVFKEMLKTLTDRAVRISDTFYYLQVPPKEEREEENAENGEQREDGENDKV